MKQFLPPRIRCTLGMMALAFAFTGLHAGQEESSPVEATLRAVSFEGHPYSGYFVQDEDGRHDIAFGLLDLRPPLTYRGPSPLAIYKDTASAEDTAGREKVASLPLQTGASYLLVFSGTPSNVTIQPLPYPVTNFPFNSARFLNTTSQRLKLQFGDTQLSLPPGTGWSDAIPFAPYLRQERTESFLSTEKDEPVEEQIVYHVSSISIALTPQKTQGKAKGIGSLTRQIDLQPDTRLSIIIYQEAPDGAKSQPRLRLRVLREQ